MAEVKKSSLQSLLQGVAIPDLPAFNPAWQLKQYEDSQVIWKRKLHEFLRRLGQVLTGPNIWNEIIQQVDIDNYITNIINNIALDGDGSFGPVTVELYADYAYVDSSSAFGGTLVGKLHSTSVRLIEFTRNYAGGRNDAVNSFNTKCFAARITFDLIPPYTDDYRFEFTHNDGGRLYIDGDLVVDNWGNATTDNISGGDSIALTAGVHVPVVMEVNNKGGSDMDAELKWGCDSMPNNGGGVRDIWYSELAESS